MVETCLPGGDDLDVAHTWYPGALSAISSNLNLSSSMSSLSLGSIHSPTDRGLGDVGLAMATGSNDYLSTMALHARHGSATHAAKHRGGSVKRDASSGGAGGGGPSKPNSLEWSFHGPSGVLAGSFIFSPSQLSLLFTASDSVPGFSLTWKVRELCWWSGRNGVYP